jgi:TolB-like protein/class 3 adenylate cyclase/Tfp pilus assembly protein PilF
MPDQSFERKLAAILSADVKEYSRLMRDDEDATIRTLTAYRAAIARLVQQYRGRVVDSPGDNVLAEFGSVVDAVKSAVEIQRDLAERNVELPYHRRMEFRIGINLGDVVSEDDRIYGDGLNIAARVEGLAEGGGICISGTVYDSIESKLGLEFEYLGEHEVKNIDKPIRVYRVLSLPGAAAHRVVKAKEAVGKKWKKTALGLVATLVVVAGAFAIWEFALGPRPPRVEPASVERMAFPLPDKPSIAVLAFDNLIDDPKQDYFGDGLTEEIITALSKLDSMFVIARNSSFAYKGKPMKIRQVAEELGVRYVLEGSVRKSGDRLRITAQLIDALEGHHLWAERYDRDVKDIFAIQDDITKNIITAVQAELGDRRSVSLLADGTANLNAYLKLFQASTVSATPTRESTASARKLAREAIALDPNYASAYETLGFTHVFDLYWGLTKDPAESWKTAFELGQKARALDERAAHRLLGSLYHLDRQLEKAVAEARRFVEVFPHSAEGQFHLGRFLADADRPGEGIPLLEGALRLDPYAIGTYFSNLGAAYWMVGEYQKAVSIGEMGLKRHPDELFIHLVLAGSHIELGQVEEARKSAAEVLRISPGLTLEWLEGMLPWKDRAKVDRMIADLGKAGLQ